MKKLLLVLLFAITSVFIGVRIQNVQASRTVTFTATINPGALLTDIRDQFGISVYEPSLDLGHVINSVQCRNSDDAMAGVLGVNERRIYVDNPRAAFDGWTLTLSPVDGANANWSSQNGHQFDYNDAGVGGCIDADNDGSGGLMSIDPSQAKINSDCLECSTDNILVGSSSKKSYSESDSITLLKGDKNSDELGSWYMTGVLVDQTVPPGLEGDNYEIDMVLTATAT